MTARKLTDGRRIHTSAATTIGKAGTMRREMNAERRSDARKNAPNRKPLNVPRNADSMKRLKCGEPKKKLHTSNSNQNRLPNRQ